MFLISVDSIKANDTSHIIIGGNSFGYEFQIIVALLIAILVVLVTAWLQIRNHLCQHNTNNNNTKKNENNINHNTNNNLLNQQENKPILLSSAPSPKPIEGNPTEIPSSSPSSNSPSFTVTKRTCTETIIQQTGKDTITIKKTKTEAIDIPANLVWSIFDQGLRFAVIEDQGKREHMENSTNIWDMCNNDDHKHKRMSFSVFDGHGGDEAAKFCTQHLPQYVNQFIDEIGNHAHNHNVDDNDDEMTDHDDDDDIAAAIRKAFHKTDREFEKEAFNNKCEAGAVGVYAYYHYDPETSSGYIYVANVGDCRAILCSDGKVKQLTIDHNPKNESEKERCGNLIRDKSDLLSGAVAVTRAIGDYYRVKDNDNNNNINKDQKAKPNINDNHNDPIYKHKKLDGLSCDPHIIKHKLQDKDEFLIIACDGLWEVVKNQVAMTECRRSLRRDGDCNKAAQKLIKFAKAKSCQRNFDPNEENQTSDNISVMVIGFANKSGNVGPKSMLMRRRRHKLPSQKLNTQDI